MVAQPYEAPSRHNELLKAAQEIADKNIEIQQLQHKLEAHRVRADRAEMLNRQLESQIASPKRDVKTLYSHITLPVDQEKLDADLAKMTSAGWERFDSGVIPGEKPLRFVTLIRVAPLEPATDQPPITVTATLTEGNPVGATVQAPADPVAPAAYPPAHPSIAGLWNALYALDRFAELVQHWPRLPEYAPRIYAILESAGCDMTDVKIMKSFRLGHRADEWTLKASFPVSTQIAPGTRTALVVAGFGNVVQRDGREFIFDLPQAWVTPPRKTITASSMTIMTEGNAVGMTEGNISGTGDATAQVIRQNIAEYEIPPYLTPPIGMTRDERIEYRLGQIRAADKQFINAFLGGQQ